MLNLTDLIESPAHGAVEVGIDVVQVLSEANLISIPGKKSKELLPVQAAKNCPITDLETI